MIPARLVLAVLLALGGLAGPLRGLAQPASNTPRIGYLSGAAGSGPREEAFRQGLRELGYVEGKTIAIEWRFAGGREDRLAALIAELIGLRVEAIVTDGATVTRAARNATKIVPIVMASDSDPVGNGFVASLARPGGNVTGLSNIILGLTRKRLELLKEAVPGVSRVGIIWNPDSMPSAAAFKETQSAAQALGLKLHSFETRGPGDLESAFQAATKARVGALTVLSDALMFSLRARILDLAAKAKLPTMHTQSLWVEAGGLMSYGTHFPDLHRRAAAYVDKILKGAKPADLPVEQPTRFELVVNLKTAKALSLTIPPSLLLRAGQVIQ